MLKSVNDTIHRKSYKCYLPRKMYNWFDSRSEVDNSVTERLAVPLSANLYHGLAIDLMDELRGGLQLED